MELELSDDDITDVEVYPDSIDVSSECELVAYTRKDIILMAEALGLIVVEAS